MMTLAGRFWLVLGEVWKAYPNLLQRRSLERKNAKCVAVCWRLILIALATNLLACFLTESTDYPKNQLSLSRWIYLSGVSSYLSAIFLVKQSQFLTAKILVSVAILAQISAFVFHYGIHNHGPFFLFLTFVTNILLFDSREKLYRQIFMGASLSLFLITDFGFTSLGWKPSFEDRTFASSHVFPMLNSLLTFVWLGLIVSHFSRANERFEDDLVRERSRSDSLLLNILPAPIAARLKAEESNIADYYDQVTVLFADIVGFTTFSAQTPPEQLVRILNGLFTRFDRLMDAYAVEKIKTIGDSYMLVAGIPERSTRHAHEAAAAAIAMMQAKEQWQRDYNVNLEIRIGMHSGSAVAGVIGAKKFAFDLWGSTVNTAARMESHGVPGRIQVSQETRNLLSDTYQFSEGREIEVKGLGKVQTFLLMDGNAQQFRNRA